MNENLYIAHAKLPHTKNNNNHLACSQRQILTVHTCELSQARNYQGTLIMCHGRLALRPRRPYELIGAGSPERPPRLSHSSWALDELCREPRRWSRGHTRRQAAGVGLSRELTMARSWLIVFWQLPPLRDKRWRVCGSFVWLKRQVLILQDYWKK